MQPQSKIKLDIPEGDLASNPVNDLVLESQKDATWFLNKARYYSSFYNPPKISFDSTGLVTEKTNSGNQNWMPNIADDMVNNFSYLVGQQPNLNYKFLTMDAQQQTFQSVWTKGHTAGMLIDFANGSFLEGMEEIFFDAESFSKSVISKKNELFDKIKFAHEIKDHTQDLNNMGVQFQPFKQEFDTAEDIDEARKKYKEILEENCIDWSKEIWTREQMKFKFSKVFLHTLCGLGAIYPYVVNGKVKCKMIPCYNTLFDNREDDDYGRTMRFWGFIDYMTPADALSKFPELSAIPGAASELQAIAGNYAENITQYMNYYNGPSSRFKWWNTVNNDNLVACLKVFFIAPRDLRFKKVNKGGKDRIVSIADSEEFNTQRGDYLVNSIHQVDVIGNKWAVNFGYLKNQIRDFYNPGTPEPNMKFFIPNMLMGQPRPPMSMIKSRQDKIDLYQFKIDDLVAKNKGKVAVINAAVMGEAGIDAIDFADKLSNLGILVARTSGEYLQLTRDLDAMKIYDMSNEGALTSLLALKREEKMEMMQIIGQSEIALGQQKNYVPDQVQQSTISLSSNVMKYTVDGSFKLIEDTMQYMVNVQKMLAITGKDKDAEMIIGDTRVLKKMKGRQFENVGIRVKISDRVDKSTRNYILQLAQAWSQNPKDSLVDPDDMLMLLKEKSIDVMISKLQNAMKKKRLQAQKQQQYQMMVEQLNANKERAAASQIQDKQIAAGKEKDQLQSETKIASSALTHHASMAATNASQDAEESAPVEQA